MLLHECSTSTLRIFPRRILLSPIPHPPPTPLSEHPSQFRDVLSLLSVSSCISPLCTVPCCRGVAAIYRWELLTVHLAGLDALREGSHWPLRSYVFGLLKGTRCLPDCTEPFNTYYSLFSHPSSANPPIHQIAIRRRLVFCPYKSRRCVCE